MPSLTTIPVHNRRYTPKECLWNTAVQGEPTTEAKQQGTISRPGITTLAVAGVYLDICIFGSTLGPGVSTIGSTRKSHDGTELCNANEAALNPELGPQRNRRQPTQPSKQHRNQPNDETLTRFRAPSPRRGLTPRRTRNRMTEPNCATKMLPHRRPRPGPGRPRFQATETATLTESRPYTPDSSTPGSQRSTSSATAFHHPKPHDSTQLCTDHPHRDAWIPNSASTHRFSSLITPLESGSRYSIPHNSMIAGLRTNCESR